jgi:hypothetical protein
MIGPVTYRTGPLGRLARLALVGVFALTLLSIVGPRGSAQFRDPLILSEPSAWFLHVAMFVVFLTLVGALAEMFAGPRARRPWQIGAAVALLAALAIAALVGQATRGAVWGYPLADLVWWFDVLVVVEQVAALLLAIALGTPGCEIGVWSELFARLRGEMPRSERGLACIVGLQVVDDWEARRRMSAG